jgi:magnesium and cobalt transporter
MEDALKKGDSEQKAHALQNDTPAQRPAGEGKVLDWFKNLIANKSEDDADDSLREAIEELIEEKKEQPQSAVAVHERMLISNILELRDLPVVDVMVPRADIVAIEITAARDDLFRILAEKPHSRLPVYQNDLDNILGVIYMKDIVAAMMTKSEFEIKDIMRDAMVVSPAMRVMDLLLQMRKTRMHTAYVVDEFGGIDGLITINDLIEAIVGEIDDDGDFDIAPQLIERPNNTVIADARFPLEAFEEVYGEIFSENEEHREVDTLGGLASYIAGYVPTRGEIIKHSSGIEFEILDADPRRVMRLRVRNLPKKVERSSIED